MPVPLRPVVPESEWEEVFAFPVGPNRVLEDDGRTVRWLPMLVASSLHPRYFGLTDQGDWVLSTPRRLGGPTKSLLFGEHFDSGYYYAMPLLEFTPSRVRHDVDSVARRCALDPDALWASLPWRAIVRTALQSLRYQWVDLALDWVAVLELAEEARDDLLAISSCDHLPAATITTTNRLLRSPA